MQTIYFNNKPRIISTGTIAGPKECVGVVGKYVDKALADDTFGESTYEKAECKMLSYAIRRAIENAGLEEKDIDFLVSGDLLNQIISASFAARDFDFPFLGVYGACSTLAESYLVAASLIMFDARPVVLTITAFSLICTSTLSTLYHRAQYMFPL